MKKFKYLFLLLLPVGFYFYQKSGKKGSLDQSGVKIKSSSDGQFGNKRIVPIGGTKGLGLSSNDAVMVVDDVLSVDASKRIVNPDEGSIRSQSGNTSGVGTSPKIIRVIDSKDRERSEDSLGTGSGSRDLYTGLEVMGF